MSSLHRQSGRPYWFCAFRSADGKQHFRSTGTINKSEAKIICQGMADAGRKARKKALTPDRARRIIERTVAEVIEEGGHVLPHSSIRDYFNSWLKEKENAGAESTHLRYKGIVEKFLAHLGTRADQSLTSLAKSDILDFRDELSDTVSPGTVNTYLKVLRVALGRAVKEEIIEHNRAALVDRLSHREHERRAFTLDELRKLLGEASPEWRTMILFGLYTAQRLSDLANLTWANLDLRKQEFTLVTSKTGRTVILPLHSTLLRYISALPAGDDPQADLCPGLAGKGSSWLSNQFYDLMAQVGLVSPKDHQRAKKGRSKRRELNPISFHALRHTTGSVLADHGASDILVRDIVGHESKAVSRRYTHTSTAAKRKAINAMPDVMNLTEQMQLGFSHEEKTDPRP